jgi:hypothetical protein
MNLTMNMNQTEGSVSSAKTSDIQLEGSDPTTNRDFKQTFCGVLVGLIFAIVAVVFFVALQMISGSR